MRTIINVTNSIDIVRGIVRGIVVALENVAMSSDFLGRLHLALRRPLHAEAGKSPFKYGEMQPAYVAACYAAASSRRATWARPTSRTSTRHG